MSLVRWNKDEPSRAWTKGGRQPRITLAAVESLAVPLVQEVVFFADFRCPKCQQRVAEIMSKMNGETQSLVISVLEKKVTLTCAYPNADKQQVTSMQRRSWIKFPLIVRLFRSSCT